MTDDWRLRVDLREPSRALELKRYLESVELEHELSATLGDRVAVSNDDGEVFCYAGTREQAERAEEVIRSAATERGWEVDTELKHWHPVAEEWEDPDEPLPTTGSEREAEHEELIEQEREEAEKTGYVDWEVRVECTSHREAVELAEKLKGEGIPNIRRWHYLVVGAEDEDTANALADRLRREVPSDAKVTTEGTYQVVFNSHPRSWFSVFGGLGE